MKKEIFEKPTLELILFEEEITTFGSSGDNTKTELDEIEDDDE